MMESNDTGIEGNCEGLKLNDTTVNIERSLV